MGTRAGQPALSHGRMEPEHRMDILGVPIHQTHRPGDFKLGKTPEGNGWMARMKAGYGHVRGLDGEGAVTTKAWIGPNPEAQGAYLLHQNNAEGHDEEKLLLGWDDPVAATTAVLGHYPVGRDPIADVLDLGGQEGLHRYLSGAEHLHDEATAHEARPWLHDDSMAWRFMGKRLHAEMLEPEGEQEGAQEVQKAYEPPQPGDRWITVHPNGSGSKGHAVLLRPVEGHHGTYRVIGGAGGKLNFLKVHLNKSAEDYHAESLQRASERRTAERERLAGMTPEEREGEKAKVKQERETRKQAETEFINRVLGPEPGGEHPDLFEEGPEADPKAQARFHRERLRQAFAACKEAERKIMLDAEARVAGGLEAVGGSGGLQIDQILTAKPEQGPGYARAISMRAAANGVTADRLAKLVDDFKVREARRKGMPPPKPSAAEGPEGSGLRAQPEGQQDAIEIQQAQNQIRARAAEALQQAVEQAVADSGKLGDLLRARAVMRDAYEKAINAKRGTIFESGFQSTATDAPPEMKERLVQSLAEKMQTDRVKAFLDELEGQNPAGPTLDPYGPETKQGVEGPRGAAAWDALQEVALACMGAGMLDRDTVQTLGPEASAQVLARAVRREFNPEEQQEIVGALEQQHLEEQNTLVPEATQEAQRLRAEAQRIGGELLTTPRDYAAAAQLHANKVELLREARRGLASTLGRFEARAALIAALQAAPSEEIPVPMGRLSAGQAIQTAAAMGLQPEHYELTQDQGETLMKLKPEGQDALIQPRDQVLAAERETAMAIKRGDLDESGYLPAGFAKRPPTRHDNQLQEPPTFQRRIELPENAEPQHLQQAVNAWIGARWADGERPEAINADLRGVVARDQVPEHLHRELDALAAQLIPTHETVLDAHGEPVPDLHNGEIQRDSNGNTVFKTRMRNPRQIADSIAQIGRRYLNTGTDAQLTLNGQTVDQGALEFHEALHRALADDPRLQAAMTPHGELTSQHQAAIRDWFYREHQGAKSAASARHKATADALAELGPEPPKFDETTGGLGLFEDELGAIESPEWTAWAAKKAEIERKSSETGGTPWEAYIQAMGGLKRASAAIQDEMKGKLADRFHHHYAQTTGKQLQLETQDITHAESHLRATADPDTRDQLVREFQAKKSRLQKRQGGQFSEGSVRERMEQAGSAAEFGLGGALFGSDELEGGAPAAHWERPEAGQGERLTLGERLEGQLREAMPAAAAPFQSPDFRPVQVREGMSMDGRFAPQQRAVKAFSRLKRIGLFYGAGSGKTGILLGGVGELHRETGNGKTIMAVPSVVQDQFGSEAISMLDPGSGINIHARPGETFEQRLAAYRDPEKHAVVVTHQSLRDDIMRMAAAAQNRPEDEVREAVANGGPDVAAQVVRDALQHHGIRPDALMVDEGHDALNRIGKQDSTLAKIIDALGEHAPRYIGATGSPVKNDPSEAFDWLHKMDSKRYPLSSRDEFMRRYGQDSAITRRALKGELARYFFAERVGSGVAQHQLQHKVDLTAGQRAAADQVELAAGKLRLGEDTERWAKELAPEAFEGKPAEEHASIAETVKQAVGTFRDSALDRIINMDPHGAKIQKAVQIARDHVAEGKPVVIFAHRLDAVDHIERAMREAGLSVTSLTGRHNAAEKARRAADFMGSAGRPPQSDVIVMSDAAATGLNLQRGKAIIHMDRPMTFKTWEQRTARIDRLGQTEDVDVHDLLANHDYDYRAEERLRRKAVLAGIYQSKDGYLDDSGVAQTLRNLRERHLQSFPGAA